EHSHSSGVIGRIASIQSHVCVMSLAALLRSRINQPELSPGHQTRQGCLRGLPSSGSPVELAEDCHSHLWKPFAPIESRLPECKCSRPAPWCRCSCSPVAYPRSPGTAVGLSNRPEHGGSSMLVLSRKDWNLLWSGGLSASSACSRSRYSNSGAAACDSASRSIRPFLSIVGRCGKRSAPAANQTVLWRIPQRRWSDEDLNCRTGSRAASLTPVAPKSANDCCFLFGFSLHLRVTGSAITLVVSRLQSSLRAYFALMLRPASWLALLSRTFTFELAPTQVTLNQRRI